jgi:hypothetical protein
VTRDQFLADPLGQGLETIPIEWVRSGWGNPEFQDDIIYIIARSLSKTGSFGLVGDEWLRALPPALTSSEAANLYVRLRDESERLESEWRDKFIALFPQSADQLPASNDGAVLMDGLEDVVETGDGRCLQSTLTLAVKIPELLRAMPALAERARAKGHNLIADFIMEAYQRAKESAT